MFKICVFIVMSPQINFLKKKIPFIPTVFSACTQTPKSLYKNDLSEQKKVLSTLLHAIINQVGVINKTSNSGMLTGTDCRDGGWTPEPAGAGSQAPGGPHLGCREGVYICL
jgi:hypothetical protein